VGGAGATVRKGQKASYVVFYKQVEVGPDEGNADERKSRTFARATSVFNADQVEGLVESLPVVPVEELHDVDGFISRTNATIVHGGNRACSS